MPPEGPDAALLKRLTAGGDYKSLERVPVVETGGGMGWALIMLWF